MLAAAKKAAKALHDYAKQEKILSRCLNHFGFKKLGLAASMAGYGRRRAPVRRRRRRLA
jgi:hypothetical protein